MQRHVSQSVSAILERALKLSARQGGAFVGIEHVFCALLEKPESLPAAFLDAFLEPLMASLREMGRFIWPGNLEANNGEVFHTPRCINVLHQAEKLAARRGLEAAEAGHLLLAILADAHGAPSRAMDALGLDRGACIAALLAEMNGPNNGRSDAARPPVARKAAAPTRQPDDAVAPLLEEEGRTAAPLDTLTRDLTRLARAGKLQPAVGRDKEYFEILQILTRKTKNNIMLVGEAGVGKTQLVEGVAWHMARRTPAASGAPAFRVLELNLAALMAGTQYRGAFEARLLALLDQLKQSPDAILFIDEAHLIMGAGAVEGDGMDLANLLKPALARGEIRCIAATTLTEYRKFVERDPAIERRFQMVRVEELSVEATFKVLERIVPTLEKHHGIPVSEGAVQASVHLSQRYMPNRCLPDKAIDVLDQACARFRLKALARQNKAKRRNAPPVAIASDASVTAHDIRKVVGQMTGIPIEEITAEERKQLNALERDIRMRLIGQDEAVSKVAAAVKKSRAGLADPKRPDGVLLFLGPSGVGKTQLAKLLALHLFGSTSHFITFDMSEYVEEHSVSRLLGAPPGYAGSDEEGRLAGAVRANPFSILLFDEIEKAHPRIFDIFLPIFDEGRLKDNRGREISFRNCIIIMTSNIGADILMDNRGADARTKLVESLRNHFRPEFINRIDDIIPFYPLLFEDVRRILSLEIASVHDRLGEQKIGLHVYQRAYQYLTDKGYSPQFGARELRRVVDNEITAPISARILGNEFKPGDTIHVMEEGGVLTFSRHAPKNARALSEHVAVESAS